MHVPIRRTSALNEKFMLVRISSAEGGKCICMQGWANCEQSYGPLGALLAHMLHISAIKMNENGENEGAKGEMGKMRTRNGEKT
ncbi:hypothetical protein POVWA2_058690 [Plasmodium ovale wallikeri]|uniref:Uncharacterized protein n=1 Tax=Plasmodium ovale wallikeri TaxID=864142 RepID=A0A1A9A0I5_PLAOA|nr:hypothetical protein POVWA1_059390 [Plasmodium ovale wallikeri]SBT49705.1 hypothetical protein POVWA2_058690 [Plasmodium ovale wallikeri]